MKLENIGSDLSNHMGGFCPEALEFPACDVAEFLRVSSETLINYMHYANERLGEGSDGYMPDVNIIKIHSIFKELSDNFFPMAHTTAPLRELRIVEESKFQNIKQLLRLMQPLNNDLSEMLRDF